MLSGQGSDADLQPGKSLPGLLAQPVEKVLLAVAQGCRNGGAADDQCHLRCPVVGDSHLFCPSVLRRKPLLQGLIECRQMPCMGHQPARQQRCVFEVGVESSGVHY